VTLQPPGQQIAAWRLPSCPAVQLALPVPVPVPVLVLVLVPCCMAHQDADCCACEVVLCRRVT